MERSLANLIVDCLHSSCHDATLYENYSGCGMYGKQTTGVVTSATPGEIISLIINSAQEIVDLQADGELAYSVPTIRNDSLGLSTIYY